MRTALASALVAAMSVIALVVTGSFAAAAAGTNTTVLPYDQCVDLDGGGYSCTTGRAVIRVTDTPSGARTGTQLDNGRFEISDGTGCITTGNFQIHSNFAITPEQSGHIVIHDTQRGLAKTRCADRTLDTRCLTQSALYIQVFRDDFRLRVEVRANCDPPA